jgi:hypothetical protein
MKKYGFIFLLVFIQWSAYSQTVDFKLFDGSGTRIKNQVNENTSKYKAIQKEHRHYLKTQRKLYKHRKDSANNFSLDSLSLSLPKDSIDYLKDLQKEYFVYTDTLYAIEELMKWDSTQVYDKQEVLKYSKNRLDGNYYFDKYNGFNEDLLGYHKEIKDYRDSLKNEDISKEEKDYLIIKKKGELAKKHNTNVEGNIEKEMMSRKLIPIPTSNTEMDEFKKYPDLMSKVNQPNLPKDVNMSGIEEGMNSEDLVEQGKVVGAEHFEGKQELLEGAVGNMQKLKKKYSTVLSSNDLSTATKRSSLKGKKLKERLIFGGSFQLYIDRSSVIDLNPEVSYYLNKELNIGLGGNYRLDFDGFGKSDKPAIYGWRTFAEHSILAGFYGHIELEALHLDSSVESSKNWSHSVLSGLEKRIRLSETVEGQITMLYNFSYKNSPIYSSPWTIR